MPDLSPAHEIVHPPLSAAPVAQVTLGYDARFLRRKRLVTDAGDGFLVDLAETVSLDHGDAFLLEDGSLVEVLAAEEPLLDIRGDLPRLAWHIGNRHTPCEVGAERLLIRADPVLAGMLRQLGAQVSETTGPFRPEGGAYGQGRTMGHDHGHAHDHDHGHEHGHVHHHASPHDPSSVEEEDGDEPEVIR